MKIVWKVIKVFSQVKIKKKMSIDIEISRDIWEKSYC